MLSLALCLPLPAFRDTLLTRKLVCGYCPALQAEGEDAYLIVNVMGVGGGVHVEKLDSGEAELHALLAPGGLLARIVSTSASESRAAYRVPII